MALSYKKLWHKLLDKDMTRTQLREATGITCNALAKLGKDEPVNVEVLGKICAYLHCNIEDIMEFIPDESEQAKGGVQ